MNPIIAIDLTGLSVGTIFISALHRPKAEVMEFLFSLSSLAIVAEFSWRGYTVLALVTGFQPHTSYERILNRVLPELYPDEVDRAVYMINIDPNIDISQN
jgi:hypothetical protein